MRKQASPGVVLVLALAACRTAGVPESPKRVATTVDAPAPPDAGPEDTAAPVPAPRELPNVVTDWCIVDGWRGLDESTCYFLPTDDATPERLLVYLPGVVPPTLMNTQKDRVARVVMNASRRANVAAILPRGRRGIGPEGAVDWWAWPTTAADHAALAKSLVAEILGARAKLEEALGRRFEKTYLAGSSSGAYFLTALALNAAIAVDGFAATSGGAPGFAPPRAPVGSRPPFYVGYATGNPSSTGPKALGAYLGANGWPVKVSALPGGHGAREEYLDEALAWFEGSAGAAAGHEDAGAPTAPDRR